VAVSTPTQYRPPTHSSIRQALLASSCFVPFAAPVRLRGSLSVDGGMSEIQPVFEEGERTVTVSPFFFSRADIKPSRYVPVWWVVLPPSNPHTIDWLYDLGANARPRASHTTHNASLT
jgi:predicted acylesterase/phospholipase RssA